MVHKRMFLFFRSQSLFHTIKKTLVELFDIRRQKDLGSSFVDGMHFGLINASGNTESLLGSNGRVLLDQAVGTPELNHHALTVEEAQDADEITQPLLKQKSISDPQGHQKATPGFMRSRDQFMRKSSINASSRILRKNSVLSISANLHDLIENPVQARPEEVPVQDLMCTDVIFTLFNIALAKIEP
jgi:hypothetical protein